MPGTILITGAPGNVGTEVVRILEEQQARYRVGAYDVALARDMLGPAAPCVAFDFLDPATYAAAFAGVEKLFLVRPPALADVPRQIAPAVEAALRAGVKHVVFLSIQGVERNRFVPHHKIEQLLRESGVASTFLRAGFFMQNLSTTHREEIRQQGRIAVPVGQARTSFIDVRDIAAVAALVLTQPGHENRSYTLTGGQALDYHTVAETLSTALQRPIAYTNPGLLRFVRDQLGQGRAFGQALVMAGLYTITRWGNASTVSPDVTRLLGRPPLTLAQFAHDHRDVWQ